MRSLTFEDGKRVIRDMTDAEISEMVAAQAAPVKVRDLSPKRFEYLLALTGLGDIWDALEAATKGVDVAQYATLKAERRSDVFRLDVTLAMVAKFRPLAARIAPDVDLSDKALKAAWALAAEYGKAGK